MAFKKVKPLKTLKAGERKAGKFVKVLTKTNPRNTQKPKSFVTNNTTSAKFVKPKRKSKNLDNTKRGMSKAHPSRNSITTGRIQPRTPRNTAKSRGNVANMRQNYKQKRRSPRNTAKR